MEIISIAAQVISLILVVAIIILDKINTKIRDKIDEANNDTINYYEEEYQKLYQKYKKLLDLKCNIKTTLMFSDFTKENYFVTLEKIKKELSDDRKSDR